MNQIRVIKQEPFHDQVYNIIRSEIVAGQVKAGERILETQIAERLSVSRTPVREALRRLQQERILVSLPGGGLQVFLPSASEIIELYDCRIPLEGMAAARACQHITEEQTKELSAVLDRAEQAFTAGNPDGAVEANFQFHEIIIQNSRNDRLVQIMNSLRAPLIKYRSVNLVTRGEAIFQEHRAIYGAICARDPILAERLIREHLERDKESALKRMP
jgi:DNA-binding GntR family transcriptional regulator